MKNACDQKLKHLPERQFVILDEMVNRELGLGSILHLASGWQSCMQKMNKRITSAVLFCLKRIQLLQLQHSLLVISLWFKSDTE